MFSFQLVYKGCVFVLFEMARYRSYLYPPIIRRMLVTLEAPLWTVVSVSPFIHVRFTSYSGQSVQLAAGETKMR